MSKMITFKVSTDEAVLIAIALRNHNSQVIDNLNAQIAASLAEKELPNKVEPAEATITIKRRRGRPSKKKVNA